MKKDYYNLTKEELFELYNTNDNGLNNSEVNNKIKKYGLNILPRKKNKSIISIFFKGLIDPIVIILLIACIVSFIIGERIDAYAIIFIIVIDLVLGTLQEYKAEKNARALENLIKDKSNVIRDGKEIEINSEYLVPGDIVVLSSGEKISADMRIIESSNLMVNESILTGESINVLKNDDVIKDKVSLNNKTNMLFAGTTISTGRAICVVVETGIDTEIGEIASKVLNEKETKSPLTIRMEKFSKQIAIIIVIVAIIIACVLCIKGNHYSEIFLAVIALSVSAMPEGFPLAITMALTIAANRMSKKKVIVKKLNSVESLGSCTVIATDKTGTLTVNEQTAKIIMLPSNEKFEIEGAGYNNKGKIIGKNLDNISLITKLGIINNEALLEEKNNKWHFTGDSIDIAFLALGKKANVNIKDFKIIATIPYESENKCSVVYYEYNKEIYCTIKGSVEVVLTYCNTMNNTKLDNKIIETQNKDLASNGYRVIAVANAKVKNFEHKEVYSLSDIKDLNFEGLVGFIDPVRKEVKNSIKECMGAGIKTIMITGDHPLTSFSIAKELDLTNDFNEVATGDDVENYLKKDKKIFDDFIKSKKVFSRISPTQKLEIVNSLKRMGEFVAVTGDGVNDAPAIKSANIGISMGSGTDVAKETANMIILNDNFNSIVSGIKEGRNAYDNIRKVSYMLLSCGFAEVLFFVLAIVFNLPIPLLAVQLLWLNIVTDGLQDFALSFEKAEKGTMKEKPRSTHESLFDKVLFKEVLISGLTIGIIVFVVWIYLIKIVDMDVYIARGYIMALMVFLQNIHVFNCRSEHSSTFKIPLLSNPLILVAIFSSIILQFIVMEVPFFSTLLDTSSIPIKDLIILFSISFIILLVMELYKFIQNKKNRIN